MGHIGHEKAQSQNAVEGSWTGRINTTGRIYTTTLIYIYIYIQCRRN